MEILSVLSRYLALHSQRAVVPTYTAPSPLSLRTLAYKHAPVQCIVFLLNMYSDLYENLRSAVLAIKQMKKYKA